ncbi:MAG TPA: sigma-70 family RNA polymerase sigma factor [Terriglobales bacterium]|nr:sigma-70 family RNA polymerase sigma factor [Terriglobales bacterium]
MNVHVSYKVQRTPDIDKEIQHGIAKVQKRLQVFRPELVHLKGSLEQNSARQGIVVSLNLRLPSGQMAAHESAPTATSAIKAAFEELLAQISKHKELLRNSHSWRRHRALEGAPTPQVPFEETLAAVHPQAATSEDVRTYLNANFRRLRLYVEREITFRENSGDLAPDALSWEEVVDEAAARALDEKSEKPDLLTLEPWLYRLAIRALDDFTSRNPGTAGETNANNSRGKRAASDEGETRLQFFQPDDAVTEESVIPDNGAWTPEQIAYSDEMITLVQFALRHASAQDREAFILYAIEGFSAKEIAAITDRTPEQICHSVHNARESLRHTLPIKNSLKEKLLQNTGTIVRSAS